MLQQGSHKNSRDYKSYKPVFEEIDNIENKISQGNTFDSLVENLDIDIISEEPIERKKKLLEAAINGCFIESSLKPGIVKHRLKDKENWISI